MMGFLSPLLDRIRRRPPLSKLLLGNTVIYLVGHLFNAAIPFLLLPILTRVLSPQDYGIISMFGISISLFSAFTGLSLHGAVNVQFVKLSPHQFNDFLKTCLGLIVAGTMATSVVVALTGVWLETWLEVPRQWLLLAVVLSGLQTFSLVKLTVWQAQGQAIRYGVFQVAQSLCNALLSLALVLGAGWAWQGRVWGQAISGGVFAVLALWWLLHATDLRLPSKWRSYAKEALQFGVPLIPHVIGGLLIVAIDRLVITHLLDVAQAGIYVVALQMGQLLGLLTESVNKAYAPWLMKKLVHPSATEKDKIVLGTYLYCAFICGLALLYGWAAPYIFAILVGEAFRSASGVVIYIAMGFALGGCYYMVTNYVFFANRTGTLALITLTTGVVNVALTYLLVGRYGIIGAGQAFMATNLLSFLATWALAQKSVPMPWLSFWKPHRHSH